MCSECFNNGKRDVPTKTTKARNIDPKSTMFAAYPGVAPLAAAPYGAAPFGAVNAGVERQVIPEMIQVPVQQTVVVPQTTYQQRLIQVPVQQTVQVPKQVFEQIISCRLSTQINLS